MCYLKHTSSLPAFSGVSDPAFRGPGDKERVCGLQGLGGRFGAPMQLEPSVFSLRLSTPFAASGKGAHIPAALRVWAQSPAGNPALKLPSLPLDRGGRRWTAFGKVTSF